MKDNKIPKQFMYRDLAKGKRSVQKPKLRYKDCIKDTPKWYKRLSIIVLSMKNSRYICKCLDANFHKSVRTEFYAHTQYKMII